MTFVAVGVGVAVAAVGAGVAASNASAAKSANSKAANARTQGATMARDTNVAALTEATAVAKQKYIDVYNTMQAGIKNATASQKDALQQATDQSKKAYVDLTKQLVDASKAGLVESQKAWEDSQKYLNPYSEAGTSAIVGQQDLVGMNGNDKQQAAIDLIKNGSQFKELAAQGEDALLQNKAATGGGGIRGGNTAGALAQYRPQMLQDLIDKQFINLGNLSNLGVGASTNLATGRTAFGQETSNQINRQGQFEADSTMGQGNLDYANTMGQSAADQNLILTTAEQQAARDMGLSDAEYAQIMGIAGYQSDYYKEKAGIDSGKALADGQIIQQRNSAYGQAATSAIGSIGSGSYGGAIGSLSRSKSQPNEATYVDGYTQAKPTNFSLNAQRTAQPSYYQPQPIQQSQQYGFNGLNSPRSF